MTNPKQQARPAMSVQATRFTSVNTTDPNGYEPIQFNANLVDDKVITLKRSKGSCPLVILGTFGDTRNPNPRPGSLGSFRHDGNVTSRTGVELDYDEGHVPIGDVIARLNTAGIKCWVYTSPSNQDAPGYYKWRILAPFSAPVTGTPDFLKANHKLHVAFLTKVIQTEVAKESYKISQPFYYGRVEGADYHWAELTDGNFVDQAMSHEEKALLWLDTEPGALDTEQALDDLLSGENYHQTALSLIAQAFGKGATDPNDVINEIQGIMDLIPEQDRKPRFDEVYDREIPDMVAAVHSRDQANHPEKYEVIEPATLTTLTDQFALTGGMVEEMQDAEFIYENMIVSGHILALVGDPGAGKTAIMSQIAGDLAASGKDVYYFNGDMGTGDARRFYNQAQKHGWHLLTPQFHTGLSMKDALKAIKGLLKTEDEDLSNAVFIIDTLKQMTDMIRKEQLASVMATFRSFTGRGGTAILLSHTNKRYEEGWPVYEGTGDLRADVDEMWVMIPQKQTPSLTTVSLYGVDEGWSTGKARAMVEPVSWEVDWEESQCTVTRMPSWIDTRSKIAEEITHQKEQDVIDAITDILFLHPDGIARTELCETASAPRRRVLKVLDKYEGKYWDREVKEHNKQLYFAKISSSILD